MSNTVLVLGAGASTAMGYPVGTGLRKILIEETVNQNSDLICEINPNLEQYLEKFIFEFRNSQMNSIDEFLARRPEFSEVGRLSIAACLLSREYESLIHSCTSDDNWYQYFFNVATTHSWDDLSFRNYSIITFNYDRSLEYYFASAMMSAYGKTFQQCCEKIKELKIIHVYGSLAPCDERDPNYFPYGKGMTCTNLQKAASTLRVIPEGRMDDAVFHEAKKLLFEASKIAFLGFGFDRTNLDRLDSSATCRGLPGQNRRRMVCGTCYELTAAQISRVVEKTVGFEPGYDNKRNFYDAKCLNMLRETLVLE